MFTPGPVQPVRFERAMIFVDGTNLFCRLKAEKLILKRNLSEILRGLIGGRKLVRTYLYTIKEHLEEAVAVHGQCIKDGIRVVYGEGVPTGDGNVREKGVDALLVADMIYHAAVRNYEFALIVSTDTDFVQAIRRVEDFGCQTAVLCFCAEVPRRLWESCDLARSFDVAMLIKAGSASRMEQ
jgi:uncharacterized LabA/DUF88 family protein